MAIERPNHVWSADITYIPMQGGFLYLVAVMDWFSRYVLGWELSNTMETAFCLTALDAALRFGQPEIWNSDQGSQPGDFPSGLELFPAWRNISTSTIIGVGTSHWAIKRLLGG